MNYLTDVPVRNRLLRVLDRAVEHGDLTRDEAFGVLGAFENTTTPALHEGPAMRESQDDTEGEQS